MLCGAWLDMPLAVDGGTPRVILGGTGGSGPLMSGDEMLLFNFSSLKLCFEHIKASSAEEPSRIAEEAESWEDLLEICTSCCAGREGCFNLCLLKTVLGFGTGFTMLVLHSELERFTRADKFGAEVLCIASKYISAFP